MILADLPTDFLRICALLFGLVWGSFLNVVIHRLPRGMSLVRPASHCPGCQTPIRAFDNIPVLGWLILRGRARCCGTPISGRYPLVEAIGGVLSVALLEINVLTLPLQTPLYHAAAIYIVSLALALGLVATAFIDLEFMVIPDSVSVGGTIVGLMTFSLRGMTIDESLIGMAVGFAVVWLPFVWGYAKLRGRPGMGLGDAKLLMLAGAWFGWTGAIIVLGLAAVQGTVVAVGVLLFKGRLDEPEAVQREREELQAELASLPEAEREALQRELDADPLADAPEEGWGRARIAFGPFLILALLEVLLLGRERLVQLLLS